MGVKRCYEELSAMKKRPEKLCEIIDSVISAPTADCIKEQLTQLMRELSLCFQKELDALHSGRKKTPSEALSGTYEEMYSNWHGKMCLAAETGDRHLAFMSLVSLDNMLRGIGGEFDIGSFDALSVYDPDDLRKTSEGFDAVLRDYLQVYGIAGIKEERFRDVDAFVSAYINSENK